MKKDNYDAGAILPPELLKELLEVARAATPTDERYCDAGALAWKITRLRQERDRIGFEFESLDCYVQRLADALAIDIGPVLDWFGLAGLTAAQPISGLCQFGKELGIKGKELFIALARGLAADQRLPVPTAERNEAARNPDGENRSYDDRCLAVIRSLPWEPAAIARLNRMEREIDYEYSNQAS